MKGGYGDQNQVGDCGIIDAGKRGEKCCGTSVLAIVMMASVPAKLSLLVFSAFTTVVAPWPYF